MESGLGLNGISITKYSQDWCHIRPAPWLHTIRKQNDSIKSLSAWIGKGLSQMHRNMQERQPLLLLF